MWVGPTGRGGGGNVATAGKVETAFGGFGADNALAGACGQEFGVPAEVTADVSIEPPTDTAPPVILTPPLDPIVPPVVA